MNARAAIALLLLLPLAAGAATNYVLSWSASEVGTPATIYAAKALGSTTDTNWLLQSWCSNTTYLVLGPEATNALATNVVTRYVTNTVTRTLTNVVARTNLILKTNIVTITNVVKPPHK